MRSFVEDFEIIYGEKNMVINIHLLTHLSNCVRLNGPLYTYSNYCFEDHIGHLVSLKNGTTDIATQISEKYILEKNLQHYIHEMPTAQKFIEDIDSKQQFSVFRRISGSLLIGHPVQNSHLNEEERMLIFETLNVLDDAQIIEYNSVLLKGKLFYETNKLRKKRTNDSFIFNVQSKTFASIKSIFIFENKLYFLIDEKFEIITNGRGHCEHIYFLRELDNFNQKIIRDSSIGSKHCFVKFDTTLACSKFPNIHERN